MRRLTAIYLGYAVAAVIFLGPVAFMLWNSLRENIDITAPEPDWLSDLTLRNYQKLFEQLHFGDYLLNSLIVAGGSTAVGIVLGVPASYVFVRLRRKGLAFVILIARMAPGVLFVIPLYLVSIAIGAQVGVVLNYLMLIAAHTIITLPLTVWLLVPFFEAVPSALEEAAAIDGCDLVRRFYNVALPLAVPGLSTAISFGFIFSWNYFLFALALSNSDTVTMPVIAFNFIGEGQSNWGGLMAASAMISTPTLILTIVAQRWLIRGLTGGAVK